MIDNAEILRRRDMREAFTFTIDPSDAKDFDDALSFMLNDDGTYQIGVHIADVSFYVKAGSKTDEEAYQRGTSVYLVDRVLPMLPEELCNDLCSLKPGEDKLCMSVIFTMDQETRVLKHKICRTVIRSDARLDYDQAQEIISQNQTNDTQSRDYRDGINTGAIADQNKLLTQAIHTLHQLAVRLRAERIANGALTIEQDEMRFRLDEHKQPIEIYFEHPNEAHHLIEEFMLLANRTVARAVSGRPFIYRVHDIPDQEKLDDLKQFKHKMGARVQQQVLDLLLIRAQAKAVYSTHNIGHYGLAFTHYTHFTSPIRRYPDLMVHRLLDKYILTGKGESWPQDLLEEICEHCSTCEQDAQQSERESIKLFQALWLEQHLGETFAGHISGVTEFGLFVQLDDNRCEGLVHVSNIGNGEYWQFDEKNYRLIAAGSGQTYTLGDAVEVQVLRADANSGQIDFLLNK